LGIKGGQIRVAKSRLNKKAETARDRRLTRDEERRLLDTALQKMNTAEHQFAGALRHDRIIGALELCCRRGEMLMIQNKRVNWEPCQIGIPGATTKDKENRRIPFNPKGRVAAILERRAALGPAAFCVRQRNGSLPAEHPDRLGNSEATRARHRSEAGKGRSAMESRTARADRPPLARPAPRGRVSVARGRRRYPDHSADARTREYPSKRSAT
jgi:integrase